MMNTKSIPILPGEKQDMTGLLPPSDYGPFEGENGNF